LFFRLQGWTALIEEALQASQTSTVQMFNHAMNGATLQNVFEGIIFVSLLPLQAHAAIMHTLCHPTVPSLTALTTECPVHSLGVLKSLVLVRSVMKLLAFGY
jgi:hypothetical protein